MNATDPIRQTLISMHRRDRDRARAALPPGWSVHTGGTHEIAIALCEETPLARTETRGSKVTLFLTREDALAWSSALSEADSVIWHEQMLAGTQEQEDLK